MSIKYTVGDATLPEGLDTRFICHICNDIGGWGAGFVMALSKQWPRSETQYRNWWKQRHSVPMTLGKVQPVKVEEGLYVMNMIAQSGMGARDGFPPIRYDALRECLSKVCDFAIKHNASVHMPRIGTGLAGGDWTIIEPIIIEELVNEGVPVTVYDLPGQPFVNVNGTTHTDMPPPRKVPE